MSLPYEAYTANSEFIFKSRQDVDKHGRALELIFEDPPDLATTKDLILDHHPWISQYWSPRPDLFEYVNLELSSGLN
jgi:hypothetical protein